MTQDFYDALAPFYHLIYPNWSQSVARQAKALQSLIEARWPTGRIQTIADVSCGIGTQTLGLAALGYQVWGTNLSPAEIERARAEAKRRNLTIDFSVADMRKVAAHHDRQFDLVISCDNSVPHLLSDAEILTAMRQFHALTAPGGGCLISVRDYDNEVRQGTQVKPYGIRTEGDTRYLAFQTWDFHGGDIYDVALYLVRDEGQPTCSTQVMRSKYYAVGLETLRGLMLQAGFNQVEVLKDGFFQPVLIGLKASEAA